jgi:hypothetical protein
MTNDELDVKFLLLSDDLNYFDYIKDNRPLFAHYTSIQVLESIMRTDQVWFSSPLLMNDKQEMLHGLDLGTKLFNNSPEITQACATEPRAGALREYYRRYLEQFYAAHALQVYVFCLSEFRRNRPDGLLSMWRGYGSNGHGAALVFDTGLIHRRDEIPMIISKVTYASDDERMLILRAKFVQFAAALTSLGVSDDQLYIPAFQIFNWVKVSALTSKHDGFKEEDEWRLIYMPERDKAHVLTPRISYFIGPRGPEPKLKMSIAPIPIPPIPAWGFAEILDRIVLGPALSNPLTRIAIERMLSECKKDHFIPKLYSSTIPFRMI